MRAPASPGRHQACWAGTMKKVRATGCGGCWLGALALAAIWWFFLRRPGGCRWRCSGRSFDRSDAAATTAATGAGADLAAAPAEGSVAIPAGAGVTSELRDGKPVVKVYFDTGKTNVAPAFTPAAGGLKAYLEGHAGSKLTVSGFADPTGNAALERSPVQAPGRSGAGTTGRKRHCRHRDRAGQA